MAKTQPPFNLLIIAQRGRLQYEAVLALASLRAADPYFPGRIFVAVPEPGPLWPDPPGLDSEGALGLLEAFGAEILPFTSRHFGASYPHGNKVEALLALPEGEPFVFFDTDTLFLGPLSHVPFDFDRPTASLRREGTWPKIELYGPGYSQIWGALYSRFGLDFEATLDRSQPDEYWRRYLYFNAGFFFFRCPRIFGQKFLDYALSIRDDPPPELVCQSLDPWLDQIALPLVIAALGGGRETLPPGLLDGSVSCHYRMLPLLYARESDEVVAMLEAVSEPNRIKKVLKEYEPFLRMIYQGRGQKVRALFDQGNLPKNEAAIRNKIRREGYWMR